MKTILSLVGLLIWDWTVCGQGRIDVNPVRSSTFPVLTVPHVGPYVPTLYIPDPSNEPVTYILPGSSIDIGSTSGSSGSGTTYQIRVWTESAGTDWNAGAHFNPSLFNTPLADPPPNWFYFGYNSFPPWSSWFPPTKIEDMTVVPEPASYALAGLGVALLLGFRSRR